MGRALVVGEVRQGAAAGPRAAGLARLSEAFIAALAADYDAFGAEAIAALRIEKPADYVKLVAALLPKESEKAAEGGVHGKRPVTIEVRFIKPKG
jgi:hypothetical protein